MILYVETNFLLGIASGQETHLDTLFQIPRRDLTIAMPDICVMEALTATRNKINLSNRFEQEIDSRISDIRRSVASGHAISLRAHLEQARIENRNLVNEIERRLKFAVEQAASSASRRPRITLLSLTPDALQDCLDTDYLPDANDNLILSVILSDARKRTGEKALLTGNTKDFDTAEVRVALETGDITSYFSRTEAFLGWFMHH